ncbi:YqkE family protein [Sporosarcina obsidiansis]|uniref:YqkE family protein n=1 Tax=Sporosarcina obsidiansis TaxID=2660748 RepID=UPI00129B3BE2|nr:YqkE family protein [Sporosarcina obsidiansis]
MSKKAGKVHSAQQKNNTEETVTLLSDLVSDDILAKLKNAKSELTTAEQKKKELEKEKRIKERKEREKNKSFEELLKEYGDQGTKY